MSWDVYAARPPHLGAALEDLPTGRALPIIGTPDDIIDTVRKAAPHVVADDPTWLTFKGDDHWIEMLLGKDVHVRDVTFFIRSGEGAVPVVLEVCRALRITPYDTETGQRLTESSRPPEPPPEDEDEGEGKRRWWRR